MVLKLDPRFHAVWRSPDSLQFGVDNPVVVLHTVTLVAERMIAALACGVSRSGLSMIGQDAGGDESEVTQLLSTLAPVMLHDSPAVTPRRPEVALHGRGDTVDLIESLLTANEIHVVRNIRGDEQPKFSIMVSHFVVEPELHGLRPWL